MIIGACGYGASGSSVITDFFREFDDVSVYDDFEFTYTYRVDGLQDLEYHLMKQYAKGITSDAAIKRFLYAARYIKTPLIHKPMKAKDFLKITDDYIKSITQTSFKGMESIDTDSGDVRRNIVALGMKKIILPKLIESFTKKACYLWPNRQMYLSVEPENFYEASKKYIKEILYAMGADPYGKIVLDQPFEGNAPWNSFPFYDDPMAIVIDRDPRDLYLEVKYHLIAEGRFIPRANVKDYCIYYRKIRTKSPRKQSERILPLQFEDLIYRYEEFEKIIMDFCGLKEHTHKKRYFNPSRSVNNTQLIRRYPAEAENIKYIENNLSEYLYPFEKYKGVDTSGEVFLGSAKYQNKKGNK